MKAMDRIKIIRQIIMGIFFIIFFSCNNSQDKMIEQSSQEEDNIPFFEKFKLWKAIIFLSLKKKKKNRLFTST